MASFQFQKLLIFGIENFKTRQYRQHYTLISIAVLYENYMADEVFAGTIRLRTWFKDGTAEATIQGNPNKDASAVVTVRAQS